MDIATLLGVVGAFGIVLAAILVGSDASPMIFLNPPSLLIVVLGTFAVVMIKFSLKQLLNAFKVATRAFMFRNEEPLELIHKIVEASQIARRDGMLALENVEVENAYLARGIQLLADGTDPEVIHGILSKDMEQTIDRHRWGARVFTASGDVAPAMGMIGTLIGLVQMLSNMDDPQSIGPAMAVALLTTLYGAMLANMFFLPIADKLSLRKEEERRIKAICLDGILAIQAGRSARVVEDLLKVYLDPKRRDAQPEDGADDAAPPAARAA